MAYLVVWDHRPHEMVLVLGHRPPSRHQVCYRALFLPLLLKESIHQWILVEVPQYQKKKKPISRPGRGDNAVTLYPRKRLLSANVTLHHRR